MNTLLSLLENDSRLTPEQIALMCDKEVGDIKAMLEGLDEGERDKLTADGWSFLNINDKIITSGTELHEGKVIS